MYVLAQLVSYVSYDILPERRQHVENGELKYPCAILYFVATVPFTAVLRKVPRKRAPQLYLHEDI